MNRIILLTLILTCGTSLIAQSPCGQQQFVDFTSLGTFTTPLLGAPDISQDIVVTGSADILVLNLNGLGIVGGLNDNLLDYLGSESMTFDFITNTGNSGNAYNITYNIPSSGQSPPANALAGEHDLEAFDRNGASLGVISPVAGSTVNVSALYSNVSISKIVLTPINTDNIRMGSISFTMECIQTLPYAVQAENGDIFIDEISARGGGVVIKSPNGECWRMTIDNNGTVQTTKIECSN